MEKLTEKTYKPRLTIPEKSNKYYTRKASGGYSPCIAGKPVTAGVPDVLPNCVGYAVGRFNEIGNYHACKYLKSTNAENMIDAAISQGLQISMTPTLGGCMVWAKGDTHNSKDGAGHVAIVECINADGSIITSDSAYNGKPFYTTKRSGDQWSAGTGKRFIGCIVNPAVARTVYRVQVGSFSTRSAAEKYRDDMKKQGFDCFVVQGEV